MDQSEARRTARALTDAGIATIADSMGGWSGQPMSLRWGVRPVAPDGQSGIYETREQLPRRWLDALDASAQPVSA